MSDTLFPLGEPEGRTPQEPAVRGRPRVMRPERRQIQLRATDLDGLLAEDHRARVVWSWVLRMDLTRFYATIRSVEGGPGRPAADPAVLLALWIFATLDGVGSAREIERLTQEHDAYRWLRGGVQLDYHTLSDFRSAREHDLDALLTQHVATLLVEGLVDMEAVAQDGMKLRAAAGASSFRRRRRLKDCLRAARQQVDALRKEIHEDPNASSRRREAARVRAAQDRERRVASAMKQMEQVEAARRRREKKEQARASTTDPESRVMRMAGGEFRPAYNAQIATDVRHGFVVGVDVTNSGGDMGKLPPMLDQLERRYGRVPRKVLVDGGYAARDDIEDATDRGCVVYAPPMSRGSDPFAPQRRDGPGVRAWRRRMKTGVAKAIYKLRASTSEWVNAGARNRGLRQLLVRGIGKSRCVLLLHALAHNLLREARLRPALRTA